MEPYVAETLDELVAGATDRVEVRTLRREVGARFERLRIDGVPHFLKVLSAEDDWIMRVTGNTTTGSSRSGGPACTPASRRHRPHDRRHGARGRRASARLAILMTDCSETWCRPATTPVPAEHHAGLIDHMAAMHAHFLGWHDDLGLHDLARRCSSSRPRPSPPS